MLTSDRLTFLARYGMVGGLFFLPGDKRRKVERWLRGREEFVRIKAADRVLVSFGKSGRTWLRVMLSRFYQQSYGVPEGVMLEYDNLKRLNPAIPSVFFTHGNYLRDYTGHWDDRSDYYGAKVLFLARDPRDIAVSQYFHWKFRMHPGKKLLNGYPPQGREVELFDFVVKEPAGLPAILDFYQIWERELPRLADPLVIRYEDMRAAPQRALTRVLQFFGTPGNEAQVSDAVAFASYDNMKRLEETESLGFSGQRLVPKDRANPSSYKVRRAKVGGWRDYFDDRQVAQIEAMVDARAAPLFGYAERQKTEPIRQ
jgi:hypothetical protein